MSLTWARLTLRLSRFELLAFGGFIVVFIVATILAAAWIDSMRPPAECLVATAEPVAGCEAKLNAWYSAQYSPAGLSVGLLIFLSFAAGLFLGVPIVAREIERGTSRLAWSLAPSRTRWFLERMVPILIALALITFVAGIAADRFVGVVTPGVDLSNAFTAFGFRGLLIASRALFIFGVAVLVGAVVARALPAVILTAVIVTIGLAGGERFHQEILEREAVAIPADGNDNGIGRLGDLFITQKFVLPDGRLVDYSYFSGADPYDQEGNPKYPIVSIVVPGERFRFVETREALVLAAGTLVSLLLSAFVVSRRRPG